VGTFVDACWCYYVRLLHRWPHPHFLFCHLVCFFFYPLLFPSVAPSTLLVLPSGPLPRCPPRLDVPTPTSDASVSAICQLFLYPGSWGLIHQVLYPPNHPLAVPRYRIHFSHASATPASSAPAPATAATIPRYTPAPLVALAALPSILLPSRTIVEEGRNTTEMSKCRDCHSP